MYAILQQGGHQYRVAPGDRLLVDRLEAEVGSVVGLEPVLLVHDGDAATIGTPLVAGARIAAVVVSHRKGRKIRVFKYKPKKRYRRTHGHRSLLTELRVQAVLAAGDPLPDAEPQPLRAPGAAASSPAPSSRPRAAAAARSRRRDTPAAEAAEVAETAKVAETKPAAAPRRARTTKPAADAPAANEE